jgi:hypothetical protein
VDGNFGGSMNEVQLTVTLEEAVAIVNVLGSLPTHQGAHPLWAKLRAQVEVLLPAETVDPKE